MAKEVKTQKNSKKKEVNKKEKNNTSKKVLPKKEVKEEIKEEVKEVKVEKVKKERKKSNFNFNNFFKKVDDKRWSILLFVVGFLMATLLFRCILWPDRIATLSDGTQPVATLDGKNITADKLYEIMKNHYSVSLFLNEVDDMILSKKYEENSEMLDEINKTAEYYYSMYEQYYGYTKEQFLTNNGFSSENDFIDYLKLDHRRNKYYDAYVESLVTEKEIDKYYEDDVFGDVDSKHILVSIKGKDEEEGLTDSEASALAKEIIKKLDSGKTWDEVKEEYKDQITAEELGYQAYNANLESSYLEECKKLSVGTYSKTPVLTSYGYHIVYKIDQKEKPKLDTVKDDIIDAIAAKKKSADSNLYYKALVKMREEAKLEFTDTKLKEEYDKYVNNYK